MSDLDEALHDEYVRNDAALGVAAQLAFFNEHTPKGYASLYAYNVVYLLERQTEIASLLGLDTD